MHDWLIWILLVLLEIFDHTFHVILLKRLLTLCIYYNNLTLFILFILL